jgi:hypothetical protein
MSCSAKVFSFDREENISAFGHDRLSGIDQHLGAYQSRAVELAKIGTMRADGVNMDAGPQPLRF